MKKGKSKKRGTPATKEFGSEVVIEVNHEEWICILCQEAVGEHMVCCQHCEKWAHESRAGYCKKNSDTFASFVHSKMFLFYSLSKF
jgi:hypothetical protein